MTISRSSELFVNVLLIFDVYDPNKLLFLKVSVLFIKLALLVSLRVTTSLKNNMRITIVTQICS